MSDAITCPACGKEQAAATDCRGCGIVFARYGEARSLFTARRTPTRGPRSPRAALTELRPSWRVVLLAMAFGLIGGYAIWFDVDDADVAFADAGIVEIPPEVAVAGAPEEAVVEAPGLTADQLRWGEVDEWVAGSAAMEASDDDASVSAQKRPDDPSGRPPADSPAAQWPDDPSGRPPADSPAAQWPDDPSGRPPADSPAAQWPDDPSGRSAADSPAAQWPDDPSGRSAADSPAAQRRDDPSGRPPADSPAAQRRDDPSGRPPADSPATQRRDDPSGRPPADSTAPQWPDDPSGRSPAPRPPRGETTADYAARGGGTPNERFDPVGTRGWYEGLDGYERALDERDRSDKTLVVYFHAPWCNWCARFRREYLSHPDMKAFLDRTVRVHIDPENSEGEAELATLFGVRAFPSFFVVPAGTERPERLHPFLGDVELDPEEFASRAAYVARGVVFPYDEPDVLSFDGLRPLDSDGRGRSPRNRRGRP